MRLARSHFYAGGSGAFVPGLLFAAGAQGVWFDPSDRSTLFQDAAGTTPVTAAGQPVALMQDKSGNGWHLSQATGTKCPLYQVDGAGYPYLLFDGVDDFFYKSGIPLTQPFDRVSALRQVTWVANHLVYSATVTAAQLMQNPTTPSLRAYDGGGAATVSSAGLAVGTAGVVTERHVAANNQIAVNGGAFVAGDGGSVASSGMSIAADPSGANAVNLAFYGCVAVAGSLTAAQLAQLRTFLGGKCGVAL